MISIKRSDNTEFVFGTVFKILSLSGAGNLEVDIFSEKKAAGNGDIITGQRIPSRIITITAACVSSALNDISRRTASRFFNPNYTYKMYINYKDNPVWIPCVVDSIDLPTSNIYVSQVMTLIMFCSDPYFRSVDEFGKDIAGNTPMMGFPLLSSLTSGFITGLFTYPEFVYIENDGDTETFCRAVVVAYGAVTGFKLSKDVNTYVKFNQALSVGDELVLDFINASVTLNGVNANRYIDRASTFFAIDTGGCNISFSADDGTTLLSCTIYYNKLYAGV